MGFRWNLFGNDNYGVAYKQILDELSCIRKELCPSASQSNLKAKHFSTSNASLDGTLVDADGVSLENWLAEARNYNNIVDLELGVVGTRTNCVVIYDDKPTDYNFDVEGNWGLATIANKAQFISFLTSNGATSVYVKSFSLVGTRLKADIDVKGLEILNLNGIVPTKVNRISGFDSSLNTLNFEDGDLTEFNPTLPLPISLEAIILNGNNITTAGYAISEAWANLQTPFTNNCDISFSGNTNSVAGTNFASILSTKNVSVSA